MKNIFCLLLLIVALGWGGFAEAQQAKKLPHVAFFQVGSSSMPLDAFREGLRALDYAEGQTIVIDYRTAKGNSDALPKLAADIVRQKPDVIVAVGTLTTVAAK